MQQYWDKHPFQYEIAMILREGQWVSHAFEWVFMMISRFSGYAMTIAVGYLIFYAIEFKHSLDALVAHPTLPDQLAVFSNVLINVGPELVFPGVVVLCIKSFTARRWLDGVAYLITTIAFVILTMVLLDAFMNDGINKDFLATMLFWRAGGALFYTVVVAYCGGHGGLDLRSLLGELDTLRGQVDGGQHIVSTLQEHLSDAQHQVSTLQEQVQSGQRTASTLRQNVVGEQQRADGLQAELDAQMPVIASLKREITAGHIETETALAQVAGKQQELIDLRAMLENGQEWQVSEVQHLLQAERHKTATLQQHIVDEELAGVTLRRELHEVRVVGDALRVQLEAKQREVEGMRTLLENGQHATRLQGNQQHRMSTTTVTAGQHRQVSNQQQPVDGEHSLSTEQENSGQAVDSEHRVIHLDTTRPRKSGQDAENAIGERIKEVLSTEPELSDRKIAKQLGCSPTTVGKWRETLERERALSRA